MILLSVGLISIRLAYYQKQIFIEQNGRIGLFYSLLPTSKNTYFDNHPQKTPVWKFESPAKKFLELLERERKKKVQLDALKRVRERVSLYLCPVTPPPSGTDH